MAEWEHKERNWSHSWQDDASGERVPVRDNLTDLTRRPQWKRNSNFMKFADWLDMQCKGGWEVFKISREFNSSERRTWCIFRRLL